MKKKVECWDEWSTVILCVFSMFCFIFLCIALNGINTSGLELEMRELLHWQIQD